ncbi:MAG: hypothetical protein AAF658_16075 [Myxococcota bacterium]
MSVESEIVREARLLWARRALCRDREAQGVARRLRRRAGSPTVWIRSVRSAYRSFSEEIRVDSSLKRNHIDGFFARLAAVAAVPMDSENSQAA